MEKEYYKEEYEIYKQKAEDLWQLLDDIDTLSDMIKPSDEREYKCFYDETMKRVKKRMCIFQSDGYKLFFSNNDKFSESQTKSLECENEIVNDGSEREKRFLSKLINKIFKW